MKTPEEIVGVKNLAPETQYCCPGETQPISKSIHLGRLAAGFENCRECLHRFDSGLLPKSVIRKTHNKSDSGPGIRLSSDGFQGIAVNDLSRDVVSGIAEHALDSSAEEFFLNNSDSRPRILVGYDWRESSGDLAVGVVDVLRRWGCDIADVGEVSPPCFSFAMEQFHADLGMFVTGGTGHPKDNGLKIFDRDGIPWSAPGRLSRLRERLETTPSRFHRHSGSYQPISIEEIYQSSVFSLFENIEPARIAFACGDPILKDILSSALKRTDCETQLLPSNFSEPDFPRQLTSFRYAVRERHVDLAVLIRPDGQSVHLFDERGKEVAPEFLVNLLRSTMPPAPVEEQERSMSIAPTDLNSDSLEELLRAQQMRSTPIVTDQSGRYWILNARPRCDALRVTALVLKAFGFSKWPLSALANQNSGAPHRPPQGTSRSVPSS